MEIMVYERDIYIGNTSGFFVVGSLTTHSGINFEKKKKTGAQPEIHDNINNEIKYSETKRNKHKISKALSVTCSCF